MPWHEFVAFARDPRIREVTGIPALWTNHPEQGDIFWPKPIDGIAVSRETPEGYSWVWKRGKR